MTTTGEVAPTAGHTVPQARHVIRRTRLHQRLAEMADAPITLISAPAGSGKTLLAASWLSSRAADDVAWLTLRPADGARPVFWRGLAAALADVLPDAHRDGALADSVTAVEEAPVRVAQLIENNASAVLLVLDNLHDVSTAEVHSGLLQLVSNAPRNLRTVAVTRHDPPWPLHKMRLDGLVQQLRAADLAFDQDEAAAMFAEMNVAVAPEQLARLVNRTEGWAAGLRLAALGVSSAGDPERFIDRFSGDDHSVADYLLREVLDRQSADWQDFLVRIAIVEEICGELADALTGHTDGAQRLAALASGNVFVHALGRSGRWYRLHNLLIDFLNGRMTDPHLRSELNRRAAQWYRDRQQPWPALRHALAGGHWDLAADIVGVYVATFVTRDLPAELEALLAPLPMEVLLTHPGLAVGLASARGMRGDFTDVELLTESARTELPRLPAAQQPRLAVALDTIEIAKRRWKGDLRRALDACRRVPTDPQALAGLGLQSWTSVRTIVLGNMGVSEFWLGDLDRARQHLGLASRGDAGDGVLLPRLNARAHLALLAWSGGELDEAGQIGQETVAECSVVGMPLAVQCSCAYIALAGVAIDRDELEVADRWLELARDSALDPCAILAVANLEAGRDAAVGRLDQGVVALRSARRRVLDAPMPAPLADRTTLLEAELLRHGGNRAEARRLVAGISDPASWAAVRWRVRAALDDGTPVTDPPQSWPAPRGLREAVAQQVLRARCASATGAQEQVMAELEHALTAAAPQRLRRPFLQEAPSIAGALRERVELGTGAAEFAVDVLDRLNGLAPAHTADGAHAVVVPLTEREGLMLRYLASTLSNVDISRALYISVNTVKTHQRMIYRKLAVNDRRDAVARGRALGLL